MRLSAGFGLGKKENNDCSGKKMFIYSGIIEEFL